MSWFEERFIPTSGRLLFNCCFCARPMFFPPSKHGKYKTCGGECAAKLRIQAKEARARACETCGLVFTPRQVNLEAGRGKYCSQKCNPSHKAMNSPEAQARARAAWREGFDSGKWAMPSGEQSSHWLGGRKATYERRKANGSIKRAKDAYLAANKEKQREWSIRRKHKTVGKIPSGTIARIAASQKWKCVACRASIKDKFHMDHIMPLSKGGEHKPYNIQLLCPTCNLSKSAKHPVDFMREKGFLL